MFQMIKIFFLLVSLSSFVYATEIISAPQGYYLQSTLSKKSLYLGEKVDFYLALHYKDAEDYEIFSPHFSGIQVEELESQEFTDTKGLQVEQIHYILTPQKEGIFSLQKLQADVEIIRGAYKNLNNKSKFTKKFTLSANTLKLEVKKLPHNVSAIGNYTLSTKVDRKNISKGELVTLAIMLQGEGNIPNLNAIDISIPKATTYLRYTTKSSREKLQTKVYEIVSDQSYIIPSLHLSYFDKKDSLVHTTSSNAITIEVNTTKKLPIKNDTRVAVKVFYFILGACSVLLFFYLYKKLSFTKKEQNPLLSKIKASSSKEALYKIMVIYIGREKEVDRVISQLEEEENSNFKQVKKELVKIVKNYSETL